MLMEELVPIENIQTKIYIIRGKKVMLDRDLADLYGVEVKRLNEQVRRNIEKFPEDFMFKLHYQEEDFLRSQNATAKNPKDRYISKVFTEHGILMLSTVLNSKIATQVSIQIMRAFVKMREWLSANLKIQKKLQELESKYNEQDKEIAVIFEAIKQLMEPPIPENKKKIGFIRTED
jgi:hypothetical protein